MRLPDLMPTQPVSRQIPASAAPFFQEYRFSDLDPENDSSLVMERILAFGSREELGWLFRFFGRDKIKAWVGENGMRRLPYRRYNLWCVLLGLPRQDKPKIGVERAWPY
jgi:hypothetical protein